MKFKLIVIEHIVFIKDIIYSYFDKYFVIHLYVEWV